MSDVVVLTYKRIVPERADYVAVLTFNRPKAANAFNKGEPDVVFMHYDPDVNTTEVLLFGPEKYDPTDKLRQSQMAMDYGDALNRQSKAMGIRTDAQKAQAKTDAQAILAN